MRRFQPALLGGLFIGVLSSLPLVGGANACCCLWVVIGGFLTVYLQRQGGGPRSTETAEAILGGLIAGAIGALITIAWTMVFASTLSPERLAEIADRLEGFGLPQDVRDRTLGMLGSSAYLLLSAMINLPVFAIFGMLGALLGSAILPKPKPPVPPPPSFPTTTIEG